jgi:hypothetical protein
MQKAFGVLAVSELEARLSMDETTLPYTLTYGGLQGDVRQSHICP